MNVLTSVWWKQSWPRCGSGTWGLALLATLTLAGVNAFSQTTVTTLTDAKHGKPGYKDGNTYATAQFKFPAGIALDPSGTRLFIADCTNNAIRMVSNLGNKSASVTISPYTSTNGINHPLAVAVDAATNIYVLNAGNQKNGSLLVFNGNYYINNNLKTVIATNATGLTNAVAMTLDSFNNAYITVKSNTVIRVTPAGVMTTVGVITNAKTYLRGIAYLSGGKLAITDAGNHGIWLMDTANTNLSNNSVKFTGFHGTNDITGPASIAAFNRPEGIVKAGNGVLVVADFLNNKVKVVDAAGNVARLYGVSSTYWRNVYKLATLGWNDGTVNATESLDTVQARNPYGLAFATSGTLYVTEVHYDLLRQVTGTGLIPLPPPAPTAPTILTVSTNYGQITLTWSAVTSATNYYVKRSDVSGGPYSVKASTTATSFTDTNVQAGQTYYYVVSAANAGGESPNSLEVPATVPRTAVSDPQIGYIEYVLNANNQRVSQFTPDKEDVFYNDISIAIVGQNSSKSFYVIVDSPTNNTIPPQGSDFIAGGYTDGLTDASAYVIPANKFYPDSTIRAVGTNIYGNPNSAIVSARYQFITYNPDVSTITNSASFTVRDGTVGSEIYYTFDGSDPLTNASAYHQSANPTNSWTITSPQIITNTLFSIRAIKQSPFTYQPSDLVTKTLLASDYHPNTISFGFASGPGSCQYVASPGQFFVVPVGLSLLPDAPPIYGLQFNLTLTNLGSSVVDPNTIDFGSLLGKPDAVNDGYYDTIEPWSFISTSQPYNDPNAFQINGDWYQNMVFSNTNNEDLLGVGWFEVLGRTNLYNTLSQNLLTFPLIFGTDPSTVPSKMVIGEYGFAIPTNANSGDIYQIQIGRPSATTFPGLSVNPYGVSVNFDAPANTNLLGPGSVNALKNVTIGQLKYLVGDATPANWYNAGDFGKSNLVNLDVIRVFDFAAYPIGHPPELSDLFDALDSCGNFGYTNQFGYYTNTGTYPAINIMLNAVTNYTVFYSYDTNLNEYIPVSSSYSTDNYTNVVDMTTYLVNVPYAITNIYQPVAPAAPITNVVMTSYLANIAPAVSTLFSGNDTNINQIAFGDGKLDVCDVYVTFRRSLDTNNLVWFQRFWTNGVRAAVAKPAPVIQFGSKIATKPATAGFVQPKDLSSATSSVPPLVVFAAGNTNATAGSVMHIPITATITGNYNLRVLMMNLSVLPAAGAPTLTTELSFSPGVLGSPTSGFTDNSNSGYYTAAWLDGTIAGVTGTVTLGTLTVTIPSGAPSGSSYTVNFAHASASPNGLASFPALTTSGTIMVQ